jgi:hypothetical protein
MNTPTRFESLLWMASPMAAWAQSSSPLPAADGAAEQQSEPQEAGLPLPAFQPG